LEWRAKLFGRSRAFGVEESDVTPKCCLHSLEASFWVVAPKFFHIDTMCSFNFGVEGGRSGWNKDVVQPKQPALRGEGMLLLYLWREPPGVFKAVIGLNHLDGKGKV